MVAVAQLVRALVCGTGGRGFKSPQPPHLFFFLLCYVVSMKIKKTMFTSIAILLFLISSVKQ